MPAGNLTDEDLKHLLTLLGSSAQDAAIKTKIEADLPAPPPPPPPAVVGVEIALTADQTRVEVTALPPGSSGADFALCKTAGGAEPLYRPKNVQLHGTVVPDAGFPFVDAIARSGQGSTVGLGGWYSTRHAGQRIHVEGPVPPPPEEPPAPPPVTGFKRGMCAGGWNRSQEVADAKKLGVNPTVRLENPSETKAFTSAGVGVVYLNSGGTSTNLPHLSDAAREHRSAVMLGLRQIKENTRYGYSSGGVKSLNVATVVTNAVAVLKKHSDVWAYELLNEPGGNWFWGGGAESQENATAYCKLVRAVYKGLTENGLLRPVLVSFDGGHAGDNSWGKKMLTADPTLFALPEVIPTNHPYDGSGANPSSTLVRWGSVEETHRLTGKWPGITEYGRPLANGTGDSPKSSEAQQAAADGAMTKKAREAGCPCTLIFGYRAGNYGVFSSGDQPLPAVAAIANA